MTKFKVYKTNKFTLMSNYHFKEKQMSLKAKGLLSLMFSLPENWDYSIKGLVKICKENKSAIQTTLKELEKFGYLKRTRFKNEKGQFDYEYNIFENPCIDKPYTEKPCTENLFTDNQPQLNTKELSTKELNTKDNLNNKDNLYYLDLSIKHNNNNKEKEKERFFENKKINNRDEL